jgi:DNA-binding transcriptional ArsR family regulator
MLKAHEVKKLKEHLQEEDPRLPIVFNALSDQNRCNIFRLFLKKNKLCVSDVSNILGISMSLASQHLKVLEVTGLVVRKKEGRTVYYLPNTQDKLVSSIVKSVI